MAKKESSVIKNFSYDEVSKNLTVELHSGKAYTYKNVPKKVVTAFEKADSKGSFFNCEVKSKYDLA